MYGENMGVTDLERTQALLMLALHEWGMCRGVRAWLAVGVAIRSAQVLGLQFERDLDDMPSATSLTMSTEAEHMGIDPHRRRSSFDKGGAFIEQEIRRRTFWSCFAMDRYLSSGKYRPQMLNLGEELNDMTGKVEAENQRRSSMPLGVNREGSGNEENGRWEVGVDEGALSRYLKILDLYGPLDPPLFPADKYKIPTGFWEQSARELFRAARSLIDLARTCHEWGVLVETPIAGFAIYTVAFVGVYAINFPWMDPDGYMCKRYPSANARTDEMTANDSASGAEAARKALELVGHMRPRLQMADGWFRTIRRCHTYFTRIKKDFRRNAKALADSGHPPEYYRQLSLREGGVGGGLEEYRLLERTLQEFGNLQDEDDMPDAADEDPVGLTRSMYDENEEGSAAVRSETMDLQEPAPDSAGLRHERWNAINTVAAAASANVPGLTPSASTVSTPQSQSQSQYNISQSGVRYHQSGAPYTASPSNSLSTPATTIPHALPMYSHIFPTAQDSTQHASLSLQQQLHPPAPQPQPPPPTSAPPSWSEKENWLNNLDTRFGGDDIAAFVAGNNWEDWASSATNARGRAGGLALFGAGRRRQMRREGCNISGLMRRWL
ncbi:hypothetical protein H2199_001935 [Coniosporium tulheliwenetii]|uniref:Uncharacterized protein n=1 Tax=Coniosporium tulheliwenetii TaxID=3383036 RepID=A0ACC2ZKN4_9PEZI|nr:hypothetical protein H2199_001935 [Cladosporium sp. JES 115]